MVCSQESDSGKFVHFSHQTPRSQQVGSADSPCKCHRHASGGDGNLTEAALVVLFLRTAGVAVQEGTTKPSNESIG